MKKFSIVLGSLMLAGSVLALAGAPRNVGVPRNSMEGDNGATEPMAKSRAHNTSSDVVLSFGTMYGVDGPFVGEDNKIRDVAGDELPWELASAKGSLSSDGHLSIQIRGLVFKKDDPDVPEALQGINDEAQFRALVSCVTEDERNNTTGMENVVTAGFPATKSGNAKISTTVHLPNPCVAPIVMILAGSEHKWFAVTGVETEDDLGDGDDEN